MPIIYKVISLALLQSLLISTLHTILTDLVWSCIHLPQLPPLDPVIRIIPSLSCIIKSQIPSSNLNFVTKGRVSLGSTLHSVGLFLQSIKWR